MMKIIEIVKEALNETLEELAAEGQEVEACESKMDIAIGGFNECLENLNTLTAKEKADIAGWFKMYIENAEEKMRLMQ